MGEIYEKQEDGSLKPIEIPEHIAKRAKAYCWLRGNGLTLEEIQFVLASPELNAY